MLGACRIQHNSAVPEITVRIAKGKERYRFVGIHYDAEYLVSVESDVYGSSPQESTCVKKGAYVERRAYKGIGQITGQRTKTILRQTSQ